MEFDVVLFTVVVAFIHYALWFDGVTVIGLLTFDHAIVD